MELLRGVSYDWKETGKHDIGLIAEEVGEVVPEVVAYEDNGVDAKGVDYARLTALLIEAVNRYESPVGHSLADTWDIAGRANSPYVWILPDTFHMNIEEVSLRGAIAAHRTRFGCFHLSDNTRHFPGLGALDFGAIIGMLDEVGYQGKLAIEGNIRTSFVSDVEVAMRCLAPHLVRK